MSEKQSFSATIKERYCLNPGSVRETYHLVVDLDGSEIEYGVGDCLGIYPENDPSLVQSVLNQWNATGSEMIEDRGGTPYSLSVFLSYRANLLRLPEEPHLDLASFCKKLAPLLPRYYSIASSMQVVGREAHLTVGLIDGLCSHYLCKRAPVGKPILSIFHHPSRNFCLPPESHDKPIIMVGPGTGIAPFRAFMQERIIRSASNKNWLFFGERHQEKDFYYQSDWQPLIHAGKLKLTCAFSRDQLEKIYVQHRMLEHGAELWKWLSEGAYLFVCGDASKMAKDVDKTLLAIIEKEGGLSPEGAKAFVKELKKDGRYLRDVY